MEWKHGICATSARRAAPRPTSPRPGSASSAPCGPMPISSPPSWAASRSSSTSSPPTDPDPPPRETSVPRARNVSSAGARDVSSAGPRRHVRGRETAYADALPHSSLDVGPLLAHPAVAEPHDIHAPDVTGLAVGVGRNSPAPGRRGHLRRRPPPRRRRTPSPTNSSRTRPHARRPSRRSSARQGARSTRRCSRRRECP